MFDATPRFEMLSGRRRVDECCVESDLVRAMQHGGPELGDAQHTDPEHGHTKVFHSP
jgi:hypothetical protein